jgi:glycosyltransferase involved in cell wall biosynthesis
LKKIVIVTRRMVMGGIEKSLISMLESMSEEDYDVTVLVMGYGGELEDDIPKYVNYKCLNGEENSIIEKIWNCTRKRRYVSAFRIGFYAILEKRSRTVFQQEMYHSKMLPILDTEYDLAIAYHVPASFPVVYVINNIKAKTKAAWIHSDVSQYEKPLRRYQNFYEKYDKIYCVSKYAMNTFKEMYPNLKGKTSLFYNIMDKKQLEYSALKGEGYVDEFIGIRILTVGRLTEEKGQEIIPGILTKLVAEGFNIRWYCIGDGQCRPAIEKLIKKYNLEETLILLGTKNNPYSYIDQCDIYVQPSRHEGYCITLAEARAFNKPIVTTDSMGGMEQIGNGQNGLITKFDENELFMAIKKLITNEELRYKFEKTLKRDNVSTTSEIKKLKECFR